LARLWYGGDPATFAVAKGTAGQAIQGGGLGTLALLPEAAVTFTVWDSPTGGTQKTDLLNESGGAITVVTSSIVADTLAAIRPFQGPDGYQDDLWLEGAGGYRYRVAPYSETLFTRLGTVEGRLDAFVINDATDVSGTPTNGQVLTFNTGTGQWGPAAAGSGTVQTVAGVSPTAGDVPQASLVTALAVVPLSRVYLISKYSAGWETRSTIPGVASAAGVEWVGLSTNGEPSTAIAGDLRTYTDA
jgi:hypothetical protein